MKFDFNDQATMNVYVFIMRTIHEMIQYQDYDSFHYPPDNNAGFNLSKLISDWSEELMSNFSSFGISCEDLNDHLKTEDNNLNKLICHTIYVYAKNKVEVHFAKEGVKVAD